MLSLKPTLPELDKGPKNNLLQSVEVVKLQRQVFLADWISNLTFRISEEKQIFTKAQNCVLPYFMSDRMNKAGENDFAPLDLGSIFVAFSIPILRQNPWLKL